MEAVREITRWDVEYRQPNHDYLLDGDRIIAYRQWGQGPVISCSSKIKLDRRGRKFEKLVPSPFGEVQKDPVTYREIQGSKGVVYRIDLGSGSCTCPGFTFRGTCKHVKEIA